MRYAYMGDILDIIYYEKSKWWNMMEPIYREFDILWFDLMLPQGREQCTANMNYMSEKYCKLLLVVEEYRSTVQYSMMDGSNGILSTVVKVQCSMMNCSNDILSTVVVSYSSGIFIEIRYSFCTLW